MQLDKAIKERHSVRKYSSKKPNWRTIIEAIDSVRYAPMAGNNFTLKIILVDEKDKIQKIAEACQQNFVGQAHYLVVFCSEPSRVINAYAGAGRVYLRQQAGAAIQNFLLKAEDLGLATCWVGHFLEDEVKSALKIPEGVDVEAILPIGLEYEKPRTRRAKIDIDNILYFNTYKNKKMVKQTTSE